MAEEYIEREAAIKAVCKDVDAFSIRAERLLMAVPAADVTPVVRGRWEDWYSGWTPSKRCSCCKTEFTQMPMKVVKVGEKISPIKNFCPNCGAKMEVHDG